MSTPAMVVDEVVARWGLPAGACVRLAGDVSQRAYYRVPLPGGEPATAVLMLTPAEEASKLADWLAIGDYLDHRGVAVPRVLRRDEERLALLIDDVGDRLLTLLPDPLEADAWYRRVLGDLARLEVQAATEPDEASPAHARDLSEQRIRWELRRFRKVVAGPLADLSDDERFVWKAGEDQLAAALRSGPQTWMHRDLHARNLLVHDGRIWWIDFQDAMRGPWLYDVASLLFDPYAALAEPRRMALREDYLNLPGRVHQVVGGREVERLWWTCVSQRLVHCVACYVWVWEHRGIDTYLPYLGFALRELQAALEQCAAAEPLARVMAPRWDAAHERWSGYAG